MGLLAVVILLVALAAPSLQHGPGGYNPHPGSRGPIGDILKGGRDFCATDRDCPRGFFCRIGKCVPRIIPVNDQPRGGHCGFLAPDCFVNEYNAVNIWTFDHKLHRCVLVKVRPECAYTYGNMKNVFKTHSDCRRHCHPPY